MNRLYFTDNLSLLETDIKVYLGKEINVIKTYHNAGSLPRSELRWPKLMALIERDETRARLERFVQADDVLMRRLGTV